MWDILHMVPIFRDIPQVSCVVKDCMDGCLTRDCRWDAINNILQNIYWLIYHVTNPFHSFSRIVAPFSQ